jgi:hypothetical protein
VALVHGGRRLAPGAYRLVLARVGASSGAMTAAFSIVS